jgi:predicted GTPase
VEEREEYEPYVEAGLVVFAGVDYRSILAAAETEADVILWDGGNNDVSFLRADLTFVVVDALRPGHEVSYYPGETNLRVADVVVINKVAGASPEALDRVRANVASTNPRAVVLESDLAITVEPAGAIAGRRVLVIDDGPTVTHGGMSHGAGLIAAREGGAAEVIDPRPFAVGTIAEAYVKYPHLGPVLPALGYSDAQRRDLAATIAKSGADVIVDASPARIDRVIDVEIPVARVRYRFAQRTGKPVAALALAALASKGQPS